jgi:hypothetical protein
MHSVWVEGLARNYDASIDFLEATVRDCPDDLWEATMWLVPEPDLGAQILGPGGELVSDPAERHRLVRRNGTPWGVVWHTLEVLDAKLATGSVGWAPWRRFAGLTGADMTTLATPWSREDLLDYGNYCRQRVIETLRGVTEARAATTFGRRQESYAAYLIRLPGHVIEHGAQIREFLTAAGVASSLPYFGYAAK